MTDSAVAANPAQVAASSARAPKITVRDLSFYYNGFQAL
jgi:phosphate transport system ATP-binding protein